MRGHARRAVAVKLSTVVVSLLLGITGLAGAYSYWQSYYVHRGFKAVELVKGAHRGRRVKVTFYSEALRRKLDYLVYLPPGYTPAHRYPVFYLLHGSPGQANAFLAIVSIGIRMDNLIAEHRMRPMILVFPDGEIGGDVLSDSEWANTQAGNYESSVIDVVHDVDHRFATIPDRAHRVIAGFSAGAYGATNVALHHLGVFGSLESWSGYYRETRTGVFADASRALLDHNSPLIYVRGLAPAISTHPFRAFLLVGKNDEVSPQTQPMARRLAADGASVTYALYRGGHDWELWAAHMSQLLALASRDTTVPLRPSHGHLRTLTPGVKATPHFPCRRRPGHHARCRRRRRLPFPFFFPGSGPPGLRLPNPATPRLPAPPGALLSAGADPGGRPRSAGGTDPAGSPGGAVLSAGLLPVGAHLPPRRLGLTGLLLGLLLALGSAALINLGFLLQHRGLAESGLGGLGAALRRAWRNPRWLAGQLIGWIGFGAQIVAVGIAPLALVQAFAAGGLALSVPLGAWLFAHRIGRPQVLAVLLIAAGLAVLPIGFGTGVDHLHGGALAVAAGAGAAAGIALFTRRRAFARALAAGVFYGLADAAIKAVSVSWAVHGLGATVAVWSLVAALGTFAGFLAFQSALRTGGAITAISLMNALTALVALGCGLLAFGESLGTDPVAVLAHVLAIGVVLACVPLLAQAQAEMAHVPEPSDRTSPGSRPLAPRLDTTG